VTGKYDKHVVCVFDVARTAPFGEFLQNSAETEDFRALQTIRVDSNLLLEHGRGGPGPSSARTSS